MKLTLLVSSQLCGLLHDVFQFVSAHPIPIEICYGMLSDAKDVNTFSLSFFFSFFSAFFLFFSSVTDVDGLVLISCNNTFVAGAVL